ncbi:MAG: hypothetical protein WD696_01770 [Bryobacteraceae bacterium]
MRTELAAAALLWIQLAPIAQAQTTPRLDTTTFVVVGEGLAAGMANYGLSEVVQDKSFPAQMARQMKTAFPQPLIQGPGIGDLLGYKPLPVRMPHYPQTTVRVFPQRTDGEPEAPSLFVLNLSVPGMKLADSLHLRPVPPLIQDNNRQQTVINMILGFPALILNRDVPLWSQVEYAEAMNPTFALVALGYHEALEAAVGGDPSKMPNPAEFRANYSTILKRLRALNAEVLATTIPDPMDTAYFTQPVPAAGLLQTPPFVVLLGYNLKVEDYITRNGLSTIGNQLLRRKIEPLPPGSVMTAAVAAEIRSRVRALNTAITEAARESGAQVFDLHALFAGIRAAGANAGSRRIGANYLGGFYSLDGFYPGATGHALIANEILTFLNRTYEQSFPLLNISAIAAEDPTVEARPAGGPLFQALEFGISEPAEGVSQ